MKRPVALALLAALIAIAALALRYPERMISPGVVADVHHEFDRDCFACHKPFGGASAERCMACHKLDSIGIKTTTGIAIRKDRPGVPFHQHLSEHDCLACHGEHRGVRSLPATQRFSHELVLPEMRQRCESCHSKPKDELHQQVASDCTQCHAQKAWKPASFAHETYFPLVGEHHAACATCHEKGSFRRYTCYGCHEHSPERIRAEHAEEGIQRLDNCVECHRSGKAEEGD